MVLVVPPAFRFSVIETTLACDFHPHQTTQWAIQATTTSTWIKPHDKWLTTHHQNNNHKNRSTVFHSCIDPPGNYYKIMLYDIFVQTIEQWTVCDAFVCVLSAAVERKECTRLIIIVAWLWHGYRKVISTAWRVEVCCRWWNCFTLLQRADGNSSESLESVH